MIFGGTSDEASAVVKIISVVAAVSIKISDVVAVVDSVTLNVVS